MGPAWVDEDLSVSYVRDDGERRLEFGRQLAGYVRRHRERWDITAVLEPVQLLGSKASEVSVHLHRNAPGQLAVTIQFQLEPCRVTDGSMQPASKVPGVPSGHPALTRGKRQMASEPRLQPGPPGPAEPPAPPPGPRPRRPLPPPEPEPEPEPIPPTEPPPEPLAAEASQQTSRPAA